jgi:tryptophanyl-tRNA synthetase
MKKETIVSGIRATSKLQVGNFLGALDQFVTLQEQNPGSCYFFIADLHTLTTPFEPKTLPEQTLEVVAEYLAAGLNPETSTIFLQNQIHEHAELSWIFQCLTPLAELERMTQFKDKSRQHKTNINAGLLGYPVLMAADILIYKPSLVPVGEDQMQHLELARVVARKFNKQFGPTFPEPKNFALKPLRVLSLTEPEKKMGKSEPRGCLFIDDSPEELKAKLKKAVTGTDTKGHSKGAENLLFLLSHFGTKEHQAYFADSQQAGTLKYSELKEILAGDMADYFAEFREKKRKYLAEPDRLAQVLGDGAQKARKVAAATLAEVKAKVGLL